MQYIRGLIGIILLNFHQETLMYFQEEVWEVGAQLLGLFVGVLIMVYYSLSSLYWYIEPPFSMPTLTVVSA